MFLAKKSRSFLRKLLKDLSVNDYWYRFEWQNRESGHVHGFFWLHDGPDVSHITTNNDEKRKIIEYFDRLVCTENPNATISIRFKEHPCVD